MTSLLGTSYPLLGVFLTTLLIAGAILCIWLAVMVLVDIFASRDLSGWAKAGWTVIVFVLPLIGVVIYVIVRGRSMQLHGMKALAGTELSMGG